VTHEAFNYLLGNFLIECTPGPAPEWEINMKDFSIENVKNSFKENKVTKCENIDQIIFNSLSLDSFIIEEKFLNLYL